MFGNLILKAKALRVIEDTYRYKPAVPGFQDSTFGASVRAAKQAGGNEFDAAAIFMLAQMGVLAGSGTIDDTGRDFVEQHSGTTWYIFDRVTMKDEISSGLEDLEPFRRTLSPELPEGLAQ